MCDVRWANWPNSNMQLEMLKLFLNKTCNRFVDTGNLPVIGLRDVMCQVAAPWHTNALSAQYKVSKHGW